jgi:hypothetical protein
VALAKPPPGHGASGLGALEDLQYGGWRGIDLVRHVPLTLQEVAAEEEVDLHGWSHPIGPDGVAMAGRVSIPVQYLQAGSKRRWKVQLLQVKHVVD